MSPVDIIDACLFAIGLLALCYVRSSSFLITGSILAAFCVAVFLIKLKPIFVTIVMGSVILAELLVNERLLSNDTDWRLRYICVAAIAVVISVLCIFTLTGVLTPRTVAIIFVVLYVIQARLRRRTQNLNNAASLNEGSIQSTIVDNASRPRTNGIAVPPQNDMYAQNGTTSQNARGLRTMD